ncbi:ABC transporter ATP-binding protein [Hypericibacter sp.]|uniref:ABC transporter ATP-binding protein n=1 Tax=Hypericibacter sp. TaxID=2705401 RepID=UPI003D6C7D24
MTSMARPEHVPAPSRLPARGGAAKEALRIEDLVIAFKSPRSVVDAALGRAAPAVRAVDGVSLTVRAGETVGLVGESGSGKTTVGRAILGLIKPGAGHIFYDGQEVASLKGAALAQFRRQVQIVFQDPYSSLNPRLPVGKAIAEVLRFHRIVPEGEIAGEVRRLLDRVGLLPDMAERLPRGLSGGQRQRVGLARALAVRPRFLVLDEPVAALDVSIQAQILNLLKDLRDELGLTMLFIAHELGVVRHMSDRIAVMYLGKIVETGAAAEIFTTPRHPYTQGLLKAVPRLEPVKRTRAAVLQGEVPSPFAIPSGCRFRTRCPRAEPLCTNEPEAATLSETHEARCHFA